MRNGWLRRLCGEPTDPCFIVRRALSQQDNAYATGTHLQDVVLAHPPALKNVVHRTGIYTREFLGDRSAGRPLRTESSAKCRDDFVHSRVVRLYDHPVLHAGETNFSRTIPTTCPAR